jgi:hypothetical protein
VPIPVPHNGRSYAEPFVKDGVNRYVVEGRCDAVNPDAAGTKSAAHYQYRVDPGACAVVRLRLSDRSSSTLPDPFANATSVFTQRQEEADAFYRALTPPLTSADAANVMRQAYAGLLWSKQYFGAEHPSVG